jgi:hypothetical protein
MDTPVFEWIRDRWPGKVTAWDLGRRPLRVRLSAASAVLDPDTAIVADCEPRDFRYLIREWPDRDAAEEIAETLHQFDLERAAQPPVIEVTVTTPPDGIPRAELTQLVAEKVREVTGPQPALPDEFVVEPRWRRGGKVLLATRRARERLRRPPDVPPLPVSEDDTPTGPLPAVPDDGFELVEVHIP